MTLHFSRFIVFVLLTSVCSTVASHDARETHSEIVFDGRSVVWTIDLPWSIRKAVEAKYSDRLDGMDANEYRDVLKEYVKSTLTIYSNGQIISPQSITILNGDHHHNIGFRLIYVGLEGTIKVSNKALLEISEHQNNWHTVNHSGKTFDFVLTPENTEYVLQESAWEWYKWGKLLIFLFPVIFWLVLRNFI